MTPVPKLDMKDARRVIRAALAEDLGKGDITSAAVIPRAARFHGIVRARQALVVAGLPVAREVFRITAPRARFRARAKDGALVAAGTMLAELDGPARGLLTGERTALNLLQTLSGIATSTRAYAGRIEGTGCTLLDTRKTIPGMRLLCKYATRCGGATNHRIGLFDGVLIKDNHIVAAGSLREAVARARRAGLKNIEVECDTIEQVAEALAAGATRILLDNMNPAQLARAVALIAGRAKTEASGGVNFDTVRGIAASGVDFVSVGRITQSAPAVDIGLDWR